MGAAQSPLSAPGGGAPPGCDNPIVVEARESRPAAPPPAPAGSLAALVAAHRACTRCADAGLIPAARPVFSGRPGQRILLVGQAPGPVEHEGTRPFAGPAGRGRRRWMLRAGL